MAPKLLFSKSLGRSVSSLPPLTCSIIAEVPSEPLVTDKTFSLLFDPKTKISWPKPKKNQNNPFIFEDYCSRPKLVPVTPLYNRRRKV